MKSSELEIQIVPLHLTSELDWYLHHGTKFQYKELVMLINDVFCCTNTHKVCALRLLFLSLLLSVLHDLHTVCISVIKFLFIESKIPPGAMKSETN